MRARLGAWALGTALLVSACGGKVIVDGQGDFGSGGAGGAGGATTTGKTSSSSSTGTGTGAGPMGCAGKACGASCTVCNNVECIQGICDSFGICAPTKPSCP